MKIKIAAAFYSSELFYGKQLVDLAKQWLETEPYSDTLYELSSE